MKKLAILLSVVMMVTFTSGVCLAKKAKATKKAAKVEMLTGEVVNVDAAAGTIVIKAKDKDKTLKAEPKLLEGIAAGEKVKVEVTGDMLKSIKKVETPAKK